MPLAVAIAIAQAGDSDSDLQEVMQGAYENGILRGGKLMAVKRLIDDRRRAGKGDNQKAGGRGNRKLTSSALVRAYNQEVERQKLLTRKADLVQQRLAFVSWKSSEWGACGCDPSLAEISSRALRIGAA